MLAYPWEGRWLREGRGQQRGSAPAYAARESARASPKGFGSKETRTGAIELITACQNGKTKANGGPSGIRGCGMWHRGKWQVANAIASLLSHLQVDYIPDK